MRESGVFDIDTSDRDTQRIVTALPIDAKPGPRPPALPGPSPETATDNQHIKSPGDGSKETPLRKTHVDVAGTQHRQSTPTPFAGKPKGTGDTEITPRHSPPQLVETSLPPSAVGGARLVRKDSNGALQSLCDPLGLCREASLRPTRSDRSTNPRAG